MHCLRTCFHTQHEALVSQLLGVGSDAEGVGCMRERRLEDVEDGYKRGNIVGLYLADSIIEFLLSNGIAFSMCFFPATAFRGVFFMHW